MEASTRRRKTTSRRRSQACQNCHNRKVKCVFEPPATACNSCLLDGIACFFAKSRRGRKPRRRPSAARPAQDDEEEVPVYARGSLAVQHTPTWLAGVHRGPTSRSEASKSLDLQPDRECSASRPQTRYLSPLTEETLHRELSYASLIQRPKVIAREQEPHREYESSHSSPLSTLSGAAHRTGCNCPTGVAELPIFVNPTVADLDAQNLCFLSRKGALEIPDLPLRSALIRGYIENIHPWMPFLDLDVVHGCLQANPDPESPKISLLLLQALIFGGCASCDLAELERAGFSSRKEARKVCFDRVRLLYDFDVETDRLIVVQVLLLMTVWTNYADDDKGGWHWMGVAVTMAQNLGLHRNAATQTLSAKERRQRRRLWWSCYIRERMFVQALSRPMRIRPDEFDTPMLEHGDFELITRSAEVSEVEDIPLGYVGNQQELADFCVKLAELSVHVGTVTQLHFSMISSTAAAKSPNMSQPTSTPMLYPRSYVREEAIWSLDQKLRDWFLTLPPSCVYTAPNLRAHDSASLIQCRGYLHVAYFALVSALHRPQCSAPVGASGTSVQSRALSIDRVRNAANEMTLITRGLNDAGLLARGPPPLVMLHSSAIMFHVKQLRTEDINTRTSIIQQIFYAVQAVEALQEVYVGADIPASIIAQLLRMAHIVLLKDRMGHLRGIGFRGRTYVLDDKPTVSSTPSQQDAVDETVQSKRDSCQSPRPSWQSVRNAGPASPRLGEHELDWSILDTMSERLSPFLIDYETTAGEADPWFPGDFVSSFGLPFDC